MTQPPSSSLLPAKLSLHAERAEGLAADERHAWRHDNIGRLALFCYNHFETRMLQKLARQGITDVKPTHLRVFRNIDYDGTRVTEIAVRAKVTKGAMSQVLAECERLGYLVAVTDAQDARARLIKFTDQGQKMMASCRTAIAEVEAEFEAAIGVQKYADLTALLLEMRASLVAGDDQANHGRAFGPADR